MRCCDEENFFDEQNGTNGYNIDNLDEKYTSRKIADGRGFISKKYRPIDVDPKNEITTIDSFEFLNLFKLICTHGTNFLYPNQGCLRVSSPFQKPYNLKWRHTSKRP